MRNAESEFEAQRLRQTISLAKEQIEQARRGCEQTKADIISAKKELRENTQHSISNLWSSESFEALAALSQYANPVMDKIADYEATQDKIRRLENLIKSPYFARIDFKYDDEEEFEKIYIGRSPLMEESSYEIYVYDWRSPVAGMFYRFLTGRAFYDAPGGTISGEINLKRQYEINNGILEYYFDADVHVTDEFLRRLLSQNTAPRMKTIVETIQKEQDVVIRDIDNELMMVQGVAGSGKTSIALHRAAYLMYRGHASKLSANNIIIISPSSLFEQYISNVLPELGEDNVESVVFEELIGSVLQRPIQSRNQFLESLITHTQERERMKRGIKFKTSPEFAKILNRFVNDLPRGMIEFEDVYYRGKLIASKELLRERILNGRAATPLGLRLKLLEDFIIDLLTEESGNPIDKAEGSAVRRNLQKFTELDVESLYRRLFEDRDYFNRLAEGFECGDIFTLTREKLSADFLYYDDASAMAYLYLKINGAGKYKNIKQVIIDEAQDYYPIHYEIFNLLFPSSKLTVLGDINQTLEKHEDFSLYEQIGRIFNKKKSLLVTMDKSFRCTNEILVYSSKFLPGNADIQSFNRKGDEPGVYSGALIVTEVELCLEKGYQSIGLICKNEKNAVSLFERLKEKIDVSLITSGSSAELNGVFIIPVYLSKGLEFDAALICDADAGNYHSEDDKKLLYIACTRALHRLNLFFEGEISPLLQNG